MPVAQRTEFFQQSLGRILALMHKMAQICPATGLGGHGKLKFAPFDGFLDTPRMDWWFYECPYSFFDGNAPRRKPTPNKYIEEEPVDPGEAEHFLGAEEFEIVMQFSHVHMTAEHSLEINNILRTFRGLLQFYEDIDAYQENTPGRHA